MPIRDAKNMKKNEKGRQTAVFYRLKSTFAVAGNHANPAGYPDGFRTESEKTANFPIGQG
jgi:hypothetical protein